MIYVWPDGSWVWASEYNDYADRWRGDDYARVAVPDWCDDDDADVIAEAVAQGKQPALFIAEYYGL